MCFTGFLLLFSSQEVNVLVKERVHLSSKSRTTALEDIERDCCQTLVGWHKKGKKQRGEKGRGSRE